MGDSIKSAAGVGRFRMKEAALGSAARRCAARCGPIMGPQRAAQRLAAEPSAASFIGNRPTPAADLILSPIQLRPANAASADHDDAAVTAAMRADACRLGIGHENRQPIGMLVPPRSLELAGFAGS